MKLFRKPVIEVVAFTCEDIITVSSGADLDDEGFNNEIVKP